MLAGVMLKMGGYGFFRFSLPLCHDAAISSTCIWSIGILGVINIVYGALVAMGQTDFKSLVAYSSVSHMGYVLLGMAAMTAPGSTARHSRWSTTASRRPACSSSSASSTTGRTTAT